MSRILCLAALLVAMAAASPAHAGRGAGFGLGLVVGEPTGLSLELGLGGNSSLAGALGLDTFNRGGVYVHVDYLLRLGHLGNLGSAALVPYVGLGGVVKGGDPDIGVRVPLGLSLELGGAPVQIFAELALRVMIIPDPHGGVGGALGVRYLF